MKKLIFILLLFANPILSQETNVKSLYELLNLKQDSEIRIAIDNIDNEYQCINQSVTELPNGGRMVELDYSDGTTIDLLVSSDLYAIDSKTFVKLTVGKSKQLISSLNPTGEYDTLFVKLSEGFFLYSVFIIKPGYVSHINNWIEPGFGYIVIEHDTYDLMARLTSFDGIHHIFQEDYVFSGPDTLFFDAADAEYEVKLRPVDVNGDTMPRSPYMDDELSMMYKMNDGYWAGIHLSATSSLGIHLYFSNFTENFEPYFSNRYCNPFGENEIYYIDYQAMADGIDQDTILSNDAGNYVSSNVNFKLAEHEDFHLVNYFALEKKLKYYDPGNGYHATGAGIIFYRQIPSANNWNGTIHLNQFGNTEYTSCPYGIFFAGREGYDEDFYLRTNAFDINNDSISNYHTFQPYPDIVKVSADDTLYAAHGTSIPWLRWKNYYAELHFDGDWYGSAREKLYPFFNSQLFEVTDEDGVVITSGSGCYYYSTIDPGIYSVKLTNTHNDFGGIFGTSEATFNFNTTLQDCRPPTIRPVQIRDVNDKVRHHFNFGEDVNLYFAAADFHYYNQVFMGVDFQSVDAKLTEVKIKEHQASEWESIGVGEIYQDSLIGDLFKSDLTEYITDDSALYDLQVKVVDKSGNNAVYNFSPAFVVADFPVAINPIGVKPSNNIIVYPNPATNIISFNILNLKESNLDLVIYNSAGKVCYQSKYITEQHINIELTNFSSGVYYYSLSSNNHQQMSTGKFIVFK